MRLIVASLTLLPALHTRLPVVAPFRLPPDEGLELLLREITLDRGEGASPRGSDKGDDKELHGSWYGMVVYLPAHTAATTSCEFVSGSLSVTVCQQTRCCCVKCDCPFLGVRRAVLFFFLTVLSFCWSARRSSTTSYSIRWSISR